MDWFASGLPRAGPDAHPRTDDVVRRDAPTCARGEPLGDVAPRARAAGWDLCVVLDEEGVVLGTIEAAALAGARERAAEDAMAPAPLTLRPHLTPREAVETLTRHRREHVLVTTSDGRLVGVLRRADAERAAAGAASA